MTPTCPTCLDASYVREGRLDRFHCQQCSSWFDGGDLEVDDQGWQADIVYDDPERADLIAAELGVEAKHSRPRPGSGVAWSWFSVVPHG